MTELIVFDNAYKAVIQAKTVDEVKEIRDKMEALRLYTRQQGQGLEMQNACAEIKLRAERRAGELLAEMERAQGGNGRFGSFQAETNHSEYATAIEQAQISRPMAYRWQTVSKLPEDVFEQHIKQTKEIGEELTSSGLVRLAKSYNGNGTVVPFVAQNSGNNEWYTPEALIKAAKVVMGKIDLDPASSEIANRIVGATTYYTAEDDGLSKSWKGKVWFNPPYSKDLIADFCNKLTHHILANDITEAITLTNNATETNWFQSMAIHAQALCMIKSRVRFWNPNGDPSGPLQGQIILYFGTNKNKFKAEFQKFGMVWVNV